MVTATRLSKRIKKQVKAQAASEKIKPVCHVAHNRFSVGDKCVDYGGRPCTIRTIYGPGIYEVDLPGGGAIRFNSDLTLVDKE